MNKVKRNKPGNFPFTRKKGRNIRKRCKHKVMGEPVLVSGQRPRFKVAQTLQTAWTWTQKSWFVPGKAFAGYYFVSLSEPHRDSALALKGLIWTFWNICFFTATVQRKREIMPSCMEALVTLTLNCHCGERSFSCGLPLLTLGNLLSVFARTTPERILRRAVHPAMRHCWNPPTYDSLVGVSILSGLSGKEEWRIFLFFCVCVTWAVQPVTLTENQYAEKGPQVWTC